MPGFPTHFKIPLASPFGLHVLHVPLAVRDAPVAAPQAARGREVSRVAPRPMQALQAQTDPVTLHRGASGINFSTTGMSSAARDQSAPVRLHQSPREGGDRKSRATQGAGPARSGQVLGTGLGSLMEPAESQAAIATRHGLPTSFCDVRGEATGSPHRTWKRSDFPSATSDFYDACSGAQLDSFTQFSAGELSAENMFFLMASEKLLTLVAGSSERRELARGMQEAFSSTAAPLEPNLDGANKKRVACALAAVASGDSPNDLADVLSKAQANLLKSIGQDSYKRFRESLPA